MKRNLFSKNSISFEQQKEIYESIRTIVTDSWKEIKNSQITTPQSFYEEFLKETNPEDKKK